jgi:alpha-tubulin suppressor-like RCC1 family protein
METVVRRTHQRRLGLWILVSASLGGCYESNGRGDASDASDTPSDSSAVRIDPVVSMVAGNGRTYAMRESGSLISWGGRSFGTGTWEMAPRVERDLVGARAGTFLQDQVCFVMPDGHVRCRGSNSRGELGDGGRAEGTGDAGGVEVLGISDATQVCSGYGHGCALRRTGEVSCWGVGYLGDGLIRAEDEPSPPVAVTGIESATQVTCGSYFSCALLADATVRCWGYNGDFMLGGPLGDGTWTDRPEPVPVRGLVDVRSIATGFHGSCAVTNGGEVWCWGTPNAPHVVDRARDAGRVPIRLDVTDAVSVDVNDISLCILHRDGALSCMGENRAGNLGRVLPEDLTTRYPLGGVLGLPPAQAVAVGTTHSCALLRDGRVTCWGANLHGEIPVPPASVIAPADTFIPGIP